MLSTLVSLVATAGPLVDPTAFAQVCLLERATAERDIRWALFGCPATPAPLPAGSRPTAVIRRSEAYTSKVRADLEYDAEGRLGAIAHTFETGSPQRVIYALGPDGEITSVFPEKADRAHAPAFRRDGERVIVEWLGLRQVLGPSSFEQTVQGSQVRWTLGLEGRRHVATCVDGCGAGIRRVELDLDEHGRPVETRSYLAPPLRPFRTVYLWRDDRLVGIEVEDEDTTELRRVYDLVWP